VGKVHLLPIAVSFLVYSESSLFHSIIYIHQRRQSKTKMLYVLVNDENRYWATQAASTLHY